VQIRALGEGCKLPMKCGAEPQPLLHSTAF